MIKLFRFFVVSFLACFSLVFSSYAQVPDLSPKERDELKSRSIALVKELEQLLNVLANKGTTTSDVQDLVAIATTDEQSRIFLDSKVVLEDDLYSIDADSGTPKDVSVQKYLNDWDLFYTKSFDESVSFSDLRINDFAKKEYLYLKVYYRSQFKNKHKDFDRNFKTQHRIAIVRFDQVNGQYVAHIAGVSFFKQKNPDGSLLTQAAFEEEYKPFVKERKIRLGNVVDSTITESQIALQRKSDSLYAEAVKSQMQKTEEQQRKDVSYAKAIARGDSLVNAKELASAIEVYTEARAAKPLETYPRAKINELTKLLASGTTDPKKIFEKQMLEGDRLFKLRDYEGARQAYQSAFIIMPDQASVVEKFHTTDKVIRNKAEIRSKYTAGNFKLALKDYSRVISEDKTNPDYYFERARCYQTMGDNKKALVDLNKALELDQNFSEALILRASTYQKLKDLPKAISDYSMLVNIDPKNAEYHQRKGMLLAATNDPDKAISEFDLALSINPQDVQSATSKAEMQRKNKSFDLALASAEKAIAINPSYSSALFQKGLILLEKGNDDLAGPALVRAYKLGLSVEEEKQLTLYHDEYMGKAKAANVKNATGEAIDWATKALTVVPKSVDALYFLALQKAKEGKLNESLTYLDQSLFFKDNFVPAYVKKGQILLSQKDYSNAITPFYSAHRWEKRNIEACQGLGDAFAELKQYDSAMVWYGEALSIKSADGVTLLKRGKSHFKMENFRRALMDFENAIREDNKLAEAYFYKGKINKELRQTYNAIDDYNEALDLGYSKYECAVEIGSAYASMGNHKKAIKSFTDAITESPNRGDAYAQRGMSYLLKEDYKNALADLDEAVKIDTAISNAPIRIELGFIKLRFNDVDGAEKCFNRALDFDPYNSPANYGLGVVYFQQGKMELSMRTFEQAFLARKLEFAKIKKDPWMKPILKDKGFKRLAKAYFNN